MKNILRLAAIQLAREGIKTPTGRQIIKRVLTIIRWIKKHGKHAKVIMRGETIYQYGN